MLPTARADDDDPTDDDWYELGSGLGTGFQLDFSLDWTDPTGAATMDTQLVEAPFATGSEVFDGGCETSAEENQSTAGVFLPTGGLYYPTSSTGYDIILSCRAPSPIGSAISYELVVTGQ